MSLEDMQELVANEVRSDRTREQRLHQENELEFLTIEIDSSPARSIAVVAFIRREWPIIKATGIKAARRGGGPCGDFNALKVGLGSPRPRMRRRSGFVWLGCAPRTGSDSPVEVGRNPAHAGCQGASHIRREDTGRGVRRQIEGGNGMITALAKRSWLLGSAVMLLASAAMGPITPADARITRVVITTTTSAFDGSSFGAV
jgi:hypothetical protein